MVTRQAEPLRSLGPAALFAAKTTLASGFSWFVAANLLGNNIPVFAPLAAVLTVQVTVWESVSRGLQRVLGVVVGVLVAYGFARLAGINAWSITLVIFVSLIAGRALRLGAQGSIQVPVSALLVLVLGASTSGYAIDRVVDTAIGAGVGSLVNLIVVPRTHLRETQGEVQGFAGELAALLRDFAASMALPRIDPAAYLERARQLSDKAAATARAVQHTETAVRWNPRGRRDRAAVERLRGAISALGVVERPVRGIARALADAPEGWCPPIEVARPLNEMLLRVADELEAWAARATSATGQPEDATGTTGVGALYRGVLVATRGAEVAPETAAIVSAIALDARRIREELRGEPEVLPVARFSWQTLFAP